MEPSISLLTEFDIDEIVLAFQQLGWHKPKTLYESYLKEQSLASRLVFITRVGSVFCGYVTLKWVSEYPAFVEQNIPEIVDLNVLPEYRNRGIGTKLIRACEHTAKEQGRTLIGLGVGLIADYGSAQRLYISLGYAPDGRGLYYHHRRAIW